MVNMNGEWNEIRKVLRQKRENLARSYMNSTVSIKATHLEKPHFKDN